MEGAGDAKLQSITGNPMYVLQDVPGKGKGLVATEKISKGTRILSEEAVITISESVVSERARTSICKQVEALSEDQRRDFLSMHNIHPYRNAAEQNREARQKGLQERFDFTCLCHLCSLPLEQSQESDRRLVEIHRLDNVIYQLDTEEGLLVTPLRTLRYFDQQVLLYKEQGREDVGYAHAFVNAAQLVIANSDLARGRIFAERAASVWKTTIGGDSTLAIKHRALAQDPSKYEWFGVSKKWKTRVDEAPQGLEPSDFEDWLWRREKPQALGQLANLRSRATFLGFADLPDENGVDLGFWERSNTGTYRPRRHWCFFGEIVDFHSLFRLEMEIKDVDDTTIPLFFYTDSRGDELAPGQVQKGYTVAILDAERHAFMFSEPGIRHEEPQMIK
ncbi:hypothetical protein SLS62_006763, partial [Diatrype stigma]